MSSLSPVRDDLDLDFAFEVEFLVPQKREGVKYEKHPYRDPDVTPFQWACRAADDDAYPRILSLCVQVLQRNVTGTIRQHLGREVSTLEWDPFEAKCWILRPSTYAQSRDAVLDEYKWHGVKLRSPVLSLDRLDFWKMEIDTGIASLRVALKLHVNSTCPFNVLVRPRGRSLGLIAIKKLVTLLWLLERGLFLPLWHRRDHDPAGRPAPVTTHSTVAVSPPSWAERSQPAGATAIAMDLNVPKLQDGATREKVQRLWACETFTELSRALCGLNGRRLAFSLHKVPAMDYAGKWREPDTVVMFQYGIWHPYWGIDAFGSWLYLVRLTCRMIRMADDGFRHLLERIEHRVESFKATRHGRLWAQLLGEIGAELSQYTVWEKVIHEYRLGGMLSLEQIDMHPALEPFP